MLRDYNSRQAAATTTSVVELSPMAYQPPRSWADDCPCHSFRYRDHAPSNWLEEISCRLKFNPDRRPNYFASDPKCLVTTSQPLSFTLGTGPQVLSSVLPLCLETNYELIIVSCFWSKKSASCKDVASMLRKLSDKALRLGRVIQVRLCFSSESSWRRFNPARMKGKVHEPRYWRRLGLPAAEEISGLNLVVKSAFVPPFSVMHPKFILMDRHRAWMPSCNVSWETWFEGCIEMQGDITVKIYDFWSAFWGAAGAELPPLPSDTESNTRKYPELEIISGETEQSRARMASQTPVSLSKIPTILLPSPHRWNPHFFRRRHHTTPLTSFLQHLFRAAQSKIYIQTPNLTSRIVIKALMACLKRGVDIHIITSRRLMTLEQLVTAGSTTEHEVRHLGRYYKHRQHKRDERINKWRERVGARIVSIGTGPPRLGSLDIGYYNPKVLSDINEPVKSHLKFVCVDDEVAVLGSGNMDRASWHTSQELGIAFFSKDLATRLSQSVEDALKDRVEYAYKLST
jgi:phosphatidylserine/phosphatidylglycerophosphate/cardiolipin synthase-like enzyme